MLTHVRYFRLPKEKVVALLKRPAMPKEDGSYAVNFRPGITESPNVTPTYTISVSEYFFKEKVIDTPQGAVNTGSYGTQILITCVSSVNMDEVNKHIDSVLSEYEY